MTEEEKKAEELKKKAEEEAKKKENEVPKDKHGTPTVENSEKKEPDDPLMKELDSELKSKLGDEIYKDYANYPIKERVVMLRAISKGIDKVKGIKTEANNPATPPAPTKNKPKTILEMNDKETVFANLQNQTSFANKSAKWYKK